MFNNCSTLFWLASVNSLYNSKSCDWRTRSSAVSLLSKTIKSLGRNGFEGVVELIVVVLGGGGGGVGLNWGGGGVNVMLVVGGNGVVMLVVVGVVTLVEVLLVMLDVVTLVVGGWGVGEGSSVVLVVWGGVIVLVVLVWGGWGVVVVLVWGGWGGGLLGEVLVVLLWGGWGAVALVVVVRGGVVTLVVE